MNASPVRPILAITMGDPAGIGSEIAVRALAHQEVYDLCKPLVVGDKSCIEDAMRMVDSELKLNVVTDPADGKYELGTIDMIDLDNIKPGELQYKTCTAPQGKAAYEYIAKAIELALADKVDGTITGPINKESLNMGGYHYSGHTEIYADLTGTKDYTMMLADRDFRVVHVSTHVALREACDRCKKPRVLKCIELANEACKSLGIDKPRIGVAGLNPHCGEARMFGDEDEDEIRPAVEEAKAKGIVADGPIPADTIFSKMKGGPVRHLRHHVPRPGPHPDQALGLRL